MLITQEGIESKLGKSYLYTIHVESICKKQALLDMSCSIYVYCIS
jgi:hypothetical protein